MAEAIRTPPVGRSVQVLLKSRGPGTQSNTISRYKRLATRLTALSRLYFRRCFQMGVSQLGNQRLQDMVADAHGAAPGDQLAESASIDFPRFPQLAAFSTNGFR